MKVTQACFVSSLLLISSSEQPETACNLMSLISCLSTQGANLNVADGSVESRIVDSPQLGNPVGKVGLALQGSDLRQPWTLEGVGHHPVYECGDVECSSGQRARPSLPEVHPSSFNSTAGSPVCAKTPSETNQGTREGKAENTTHLECHKFPARAVHKCVSHFFGSR